MLSAAAGGVETSLGHPCPGLSSSSLLSMPPLRREPPGLAPKIVRQSAPLWAIPLLRPAPAPGQAPTPSTRAVRRRRPAYAPLPRPRKGRVSSPSCACALVLPSILTAPVEGTLLIFWESGTSRRLKEVNLAMRIGHRDMLAPSTPQLDSLAPAPSSKALGSFYTPDGLAEWVAFEMLAGAASGGTQLRNVVDPACGDGALLAAISRLANDSVKLTGIDINPTAVARSREALGATAHILLGDALNPSLGWGDIPPDAVIMNPPWGGELPQPKAVYRDNRYRLAYGQFDISDLFVEQALSMTRPGSVLGLILPDAVFQPDHRALRELLLEHTLLLIARLGEGIFDNVYRSTVVIVLRNGPAPAGHLVECLQLSASQRNLIGRGDLSFADAKEWHSHFVPQSRFDCNPNAVFNITQSESNHEVFRQFSERHKFKWQETVHLGRGVEIGKRGVIVSCESCGNYRPIPAGSFPTQCPSCTAMIDEWAPRRTIIRENTDAIGWSPLIVGEDVDRYWTAPRRSIRLGVPGIRYKPIEHFSARKLLIRKTGVGLRAAIDETGSATTQTVFYVIVLSQENDWILDYLQGILNSRPMLAWYMRWSGENQWRSHPYVTPRVLKDLPIPDPFADNRLTKIAQSIAEKSQMARWGCARSDYEVDWLIYELYDLDLRGIAWVNSVLADTDHRIEYFNRMRSNAVTSDDSTPATKVML